MAKTKRLFGGGKARPSSASKSEERFVYSVPKENNKPPEELGQYPICLFGEKGVGKSSLCSQFPGSFLIVTEPFRRNLAVRQVGITPLTKQVEEQIAVGDIEHPWLQIKGYINAAVEDSSVQTVALDTIDRAHALCQHYVCWTKGIESPADLEWGKGWDAIKKEFENTLNTLISARANLGVIFTSHARFREVRVKHGETFDQVTPTCTDACWGYLKAVCDFALYYGRGSEGSFIQVRGDTLVWAACGVDKAFRRRKERLPLQGFYAAASAPETYSRMLKAFQGQMLSKYELG